MLERKMQHTSLYALISEWFDNILQRIMQLSIIIVSENKQS